MQRRVMLGVAGILGAVLLVWAIAFARPYKLHGSEITTEVTAPSIVLTRNDGSVFNISDMGGQIILLFFGYTTCPDVCPTTLGDMKRVQEELGERASQVEVVFITVDPNRDSPERVQAYAAGFDDRFIGLSGSETVLEHVWQEYGVYRKIQESQSAAGYLVDHSSRLYLIDKNNNLRVTYSYGTPVENLVSDIRFLLKED